MNLKRRSFANPRTKEETRVRSPGHLSWVRGFSCCVEGRNEPGCGGKIEAAHVRTGTDGGTGLKPGDNWVIPLCGIHHSRQHQLGETSFERFYGISMKAIAADLWQKSPHRIKHERAAALMGMTDE